MERILVIFGTRPEAIKMAPVVRALKLAPGVETIVCVTAQHRQMLDEALAVFAIAPDFDLDIMQPGQTLAHTTAAVLEKLTALISTIKPARILVHGDTTTSFAAALAAFYLHIPIGHVEAGLRTGNLDAPWPEEMNRRCVDMVADMLWAPTEAAAVALKRENVDPSNIYVTGNTVVDALRMVTDRIDSDSGLQAALAAKLPKLKPGKKAILVTGHRRENFDGGLAEICLALNRLAARTDTEIVWPVHPNPNVVDTVRREMLPRDNLHLIEPLDYLSFVAMMRRSHLIVTDSGGIQEEAPSLSKPVLVTRSETERPEAVTAGSARLVGTSAERIFAAANELLDDPAAYELMAKRPNPFGDGHAAERIVGSLIERHAVVSDGA